MKRKILILILGLMMAVSAKAQIFLEEDANSNRSTYGSSEDIGVMPSHGVEFDQTNYVPLGSGVILLTALGGTYLLKKERKTVKSI